ncbi:MAG: glycosyltransferase [Gemmatimonadota bacterium]
MKLVVFGLSISSSWGNGHATLWRALCRALARRGHHTVFFERDVSYYAAHRDMLAMHGVDLVLYGDLDGIRTRAVHELASADVGMVTSYCPDAVAASALVSEHAATSVFYDLDTPVTLDGLRRGSTVPYIGERGLQDFDLVLSFTGGEALTTLRETLGARRVAPLYGSVDPSVHHPVAPVEQYRGLLSYLGTYAEDRQEMLVKLFLDPARAMSDERFIIGGAKYPHDFPWAPNVFFVQHLPPSEHPAFFCSSKLTLNITRQAMAAMGYCPSGRLFEAAACGTPILSDYWDGIAPFFTPGAELLVARDTADALAALELTDEELHRIGRAARDRTLTEHTADNRALDLERALELVRQPATELAPLSSMRRESTRADAWPAYRMET